MAVVHLLLNAVVSENAKFTTADAEDFYLGSDLPHPVWMKIPLAYFPDKTLTDLALHHLIHDKHIYFKVVKSIYGLHNAGNVAQKKLIATLAEGGYYETRTPALFRHKTNSIAFVLIVDDFGIKDSSEEDRNHLYDTIRKAYSIKTDISGKHFLGLTVDHNRIDRTITLSMPGYFPAIFEKYQPILNLPAQGTRSPCIYTPPKYGSNEPQVTDIDTLYDLLS